MELAGRSYGRIVSLVGGWAIDDMGFGMGQLGAWRENSSIGFLISEADLYTPNPRSSVSAFECPWEKAKKGHRLTQTDIDENDLAEPPRPQSHAFSPPEWDKQPSANFAH